MHVPTLCDWLILQLLLPTPTISFSLDHRQNIRDRVISGIGRNRNILIYLTLHDSVALMTTLMTLIFYFH